MARSGRALSASRIRPPARAAWSSRSARRHGRLWRPTSRATRRRPRRGHHRRDTVAPTLACPAALTISADATTGKAWVPDRTTFASASDLSGTVTLSQTPASTQSPAAQTLSIGTTPVTIRATDGSGNVRTCATNVIVADVTPPVFTLVPPNQTVEGGAAINLSAAATDNSGSAAVTNNAPAKFPLGATAVTFTARTPLATRPRQRPPSSR